MKRFVLLLVPLAALTGFVAADEPAGAEQRLQQIRRDLPLIKKLVESGLKLAEEDQPLKRVELCNELADGFAQAMQHAVANKDGARAVGLSDSLKALLQRGVTPNLTLARTQLPVDSAELKKAGEQALNVLLPLEQQLDQPAARTQDDMQNARDRLKDARTDVERAVKGRTPLQLPSVGKKVGGKKSN